MGRISERRQMGAFHSVDLRNEGTVNLVQGTADSLTIEADDRTMPEIETEVENGVLKLGFKSRWGFPWHHGEIVYHVTAREIRRLRVSGSGRMRSEAIKGLDLEVWISGSGAIDVADASIDVVKAGISGSGALTLGGKVDHLNAWISGSGMVRADRLDCCYVEVKVSGSGDAFVRASEYLEVFISGSGHVEYSGSPRMQVKTTGSGSVSQIDAG